MIDKKQPIIVKKVGHGGHGHHGGAWKVAFADFVTAMMAFFLLLWLVGGTTDEEKAAISDHFQNVSISEGMSSTPAPSSIQGPGGASTSMIAFTDTPDVKQHDKDKDEDFKQKEEDETDEDKRLAGEKEEKQVLDNLMAELKKAVDQSQALAPYKDQLLIDITPEGLRIQIIDKQNRPMFDAGSAHPKYYTVDILFELAKFIREVPNRISLTGHTDASKFRGREDYGNWELSADRANAARRALMDGGVTEKQIGRVVGLASSTLFDKADPNNPINRRISLIVMNKKADEAIERGEGVSEQYLSDREKAQEGGFDELPMEMLGPNSINIDMDDQTSEEIDPSENINDQGLSDSGKSQEGSSGELPMEMPGRDGIDEDDKVGNAIGLEEGVSEQDLPDGNKAREDDFEELPMDTF